MSSRENSQPSQQQLAELSALADGTLPETRRAPVEAQIARSPELRRLLERERRVLALLNDAATQEGAPARLHERIHAQLGRDGEDGSRSPRPRGIGGPARPAILAGLCTAVAALAVGLVLGESAGGPTLAQAETLAIRVPTRAAPNPDPRQPVKLAQAVNDVYFPNWTGRFGWIASGQRSDRLDGRKAITVFYRSTGGRSLAYTIVNSPPLSEPAAPEHRVGGVTVRGFVANGRTFVTWRRAGHTCVLSGRGATVAELNQLAAWKLPSETVS